MPSAGSDLLVLRESIARIEAFAPNGYSHGRDRDRSVLVSLGEEPLPLDAALGGGLRRGTLHEIVAAAPRDEASAAAFAVALAVRLADQGGMIWIMDDRAAWETGTPYRPGLASHGIAVDKLVLVKTKDTPTTLWATEEALRAGARVVVTELWRARTYDLAASRRLLLAARRKGATCLLVHVGLNESDDASSAAETRFAVAACPSEHRVSAGQRTPIPGGPGFAVRLLKLRGTASGGLRGYDETRSMPSHGIGKPEGFGRNGTRPWRWRQALHGSTKVSGKGLASERI